MPRFLLLFLAFLLAIGLSACTNPLADDTPATDESGLIGTWKYTTHKEYDAPAMGTTPAQHIAYDLIQRIRFEADHRIVGSVTFDYTSGSNRDTTISFPADTWSLSGSTLTINATDEDGKPTSSSGTIAIQGSSLTFTNEDGSVIFTRE